MTKYARLERALSALRTMRQHHDHRKLMSCDPRERNYRDYMISELDLAISAITEADAIADIARKYLDGMTCDSCLEHPVNACSAPVHRRPCQSCAEWKADSTKLHVFCYGKEPSDV